MPDFIYNTHSSKAAGEAEWSDSQGGINALDVFTIVEIVPYKGMGEIGYLIGGQEPVDQELMEINSAAGSISFLGDAINVYPSFTVQPVPSSGTLDSGWKLGKTFTSQDGYFVSANTWEGAVYSMNVGTKYEKVSAGTGKYKAELKAETELNDVYYNAWEPVNYKNVNAYFVLGKPAGVDLFSQKLSYKPYSVTRAADNDGDYDYDSESKTFALNKGKGAYNIIFIRADYGTNLYYMRADYEVVDAGTGDYSTNPANITYTDKVGGNYNKITNATYFSFTNDWTSKYRFVPATVPSNMADYQNDNGKIWVRGQRAIKTYEAKNKVQLVNNEWFKRYSLGVPASLVDDYKVQVVTITPDDLNKPANQHYIDEADMFYINGNYSHNQNYIMLYENYSKEGQSLPYNQKYDNNQNSKVDNLNFAVHDFSWENVIKIFKRTAGIGCNKAAMVIDSTDFQNAIYGTGGYKKLQKSVTVSYSYNGNSATLCNFAKLYIMVYQRNMVDFYNSFLNPNTTKYIITEVASSLNATGSTGSFIRPDSTNASPTADAAIYWNGNTFVPYGLNAAGEMVRFSQDSLVLNGIYNFNILATPTDLTNNVLTMNGSPIFTSTFTQPISIPADSQEEAIVHEGSLDPDGGTVSAGQITIADLNNVITNNGTGYDLTGGVSYPTGGTVEGPPSSGGSGDSSEDTTEDGNLKNYKRILNIEPTADFTDSENEIRTILTNYSIQIINMTSTQFNSNIEDINSRYDMIYIGSGSGRLNLLNGSTVFNDSSLNSNIYFSEGDKIYDSSGKIYRYRGNDISSQRKNDLNDFLSAGFPIVLDSDMYQIKNMKNGTNIYNFINQAKNVSKSKNLMNDTDYFTTSASKIAFKSRLKSCFNIVRPIIDLQQPTIAKSAEVYYDYVDPNTKTLIIKFRLLPKGSMSSSYTYNAYLYIDINGDGIFDETERLSVKSSDGSNWEGISENSLSTYKYNMADLNGAYQWKVLICRQDNPLIRSSVSGYAANTNKKTIHILQIMDGTENSLESKINDTASLIYQYAGRNVLMDYDLSIKSMTVDQFNQLYITKPYTKGTASTSGKLSNYNILILSNPSTTISTDNGALQNVMDELSNNLSVIFTKGACGFTGQTLYNLSSSCFTDYRTYNFINRFAAPVYNTKNQYYIYNNLSLNGTLNQTSTYKSIYLTKTNEGSITRYPYQIDMAMKIAENNYSNDTTIDFDLSENKRLVGWYCLSDIKSPIVNNVFSLKGDATKLNQGIYSSSPNDVKNNYYLFSNDLCYYSGITLSTADQHENDNEIKLFINTIIAAYTSSNRVVSSNPVITVIKPEPVIAADSTKSITLLPENFDGDNLNLEFKITESSSNMDLSILLDDIDPSGTWNDTIYKVSADGSLGSAISIKNMNKVVENTTYAVKIPKTELTGKNILKINAANVEGKSTFTEVMLINQNKPVITIVKPVPELDSNMAQYIYIDIDDRADTTTEENLDKTSDIRIFFQVEKASTNVKLGVSSEGSSLISGSANDVRIYKVTDAVEEDLPVNPNQTVPTGPDYLYCLHIPMSLMKNKNSRGIMITARDNYGVSGETSVTLLRRSLFPLE